MESYFLQTYSSLDFLKSAHSTKAKSVARRSVHLQYKMYKLLHLQCSIPRASSWSCGFQDFFPLKVQPLGQLLFMQRGFALFHILSRPRKRINYTCWSPRRSFWIHQTPRLENLNKNSVAPQVSTLPLEAKTLFLRTLSHCPALRIPYFQVWGQKTSHGKVTAPLTQPTRLASCIQIARRFSPFS